MRTRSRAVVLIEVKTRSSHLSSRTEYTSNNSHFTTCDAIRDGELSSFLSTKFIWIPSHSSFRVRTAINWIISYQLSLLSAIEWLPSMIWPFVRRRVKCVSRLRVEIEMRRIENCQFDCEIDDVETTEEKKKWLFDSIEWNRSLFEGE